MPHQVYSVTPSMRVPISEILPSTNEQDPVIKLLHTHSNNAWLCTIKLRMRAPIARPTVIAPLSQVRQEPNDALCSPLCQEKVPSWGLVATVDARITNHKGSLEPARARKVCSTASCWNPVKFRSFHGTSTYVWVPLLTWDKISVRRQQCIITTSVLWTCF